MLDVKAADEVAEVDDDWSWMPGQRWLIYEGRAYVLRFAGWGTGYLRYASRIAGDLVEHPLCRFAPQVSVSLAPSRAGDAAVCEAVEHGVVTYAAIDRYADPEPAPGREVPGGTTEVVGEAQVDFDNGGRPVPVYLYSVDSGAGPAACSSATMTPRRRMRPPRPATRSSRRCRGSTSRMPIRAAPAWTPSRAGSPSTG